MNQEYNIIKVNTKDLTQQQKQEVRVLFGLIPITLANVLSNKIFNWFEELFNLKTTYLLYLNNSLIGFCTYNKQSKYITSISIHKDFRKLGWGSILLKHVLKDLVGQTTKVYLHAEPSLIGYYKKFGFKEVFGDRMKLDIINI